MGACKLAAIAPLLAEAGVNVELRNTGEGVLNGGCGSDFLQKDKKLPQNFGGVPAGARCSCWAGRTCVVRRGHRGRTLSKVTWQHCLRCNTFSQPNYEPVMPCAN